MPQDNAKSGCWGCFSKLIKKFNKTDIAAIPPEIAGSAVDTVQALVGSSQIDELNAIKAQCLDLVTKINEVRENLRKMYKYANDFTANLDFENVNQEQPRDIDSKIENINTNDSLEELNQLWQTLIIQYSKSKEEHNTVADKLFSIATENTSNICINNRHRLTTQSNNLNLNERSNIMPEAQQILEALQTGQMPEQLQLTQMSLVPSESSHQEVIQYGHNVSNMLQQAAIANRMQNNKLIETIQKATGKLHILVDQYRYLRDFITSNNLSIDIQEEPSLDIPNASNNSMQELKARLINIVNLINVYKVLNNSMENDIVISDLDGDEFLDPNPKIVPNREEIPNANNTLHFRYSSSSSTDNILQQTSGNYANASTTLESKDNDRVGASKPGNTV